MSSRNVSQNLPFCKEEEKRFIDCVYCRQSGLYIKNGVKMWGKHHVKFCCKAADRRKVKRNTNRRNPSFMEEVDSDGVTWKKISKKSENRVTSGAKTILEMSQDPFSILGVMELKAENKRLKKEEEEKRLKEEESNKIHDAVIAKKAPRPSNKKPVVFGGWLIAAKTKKPVSKNKTKEEIPVVVSPKRIDILKKAKAKPAPTIFKKGKVMSFEEIKNKFSNTDSWCDSDDEF